jgi:hypothetical protein
VTTPSTDPYFFSTTLIGFATLVYLAFFGQQRRAAAEAGAVTGALR